MPRSTSGWRHLKTMAGLADVWPFPEYTSSLRLEGAYSLRRLSSLQDLLKNKGAAVLSFLMSVHTTSYGVRTRTSKKAVSKLHTQQPPWWSLSQSKSWRSPLLNRLSRLGVAKSWGLMLTEADKTAMSCDSWTGSSHFHSVPGSGHEDDYSRGTARSRRLDPAMDVVSLSEWTC
ncbi:hypothetical protein BDW75DRAFT_201757 [Aspergillus navahoensis]